MIAARIDRTSLKEELMSKICDYCNEEPATTDYGACTSCHEHFEADKPFQGPRMWVGDREIETGSEEYYFYLNQIP